MLLKHTHPFIITTHTHTPSSLLHTHTFITTHTHTPSSSLHTHTHLYHYTHTHTLCPNQVGQLRGSQTGRLLYFRRVLSGSGSQNYYSVTYMPQQLDCLVCLCVCVCVCVCV